MLILVELFQRGDVDSRVKLAGNVGWRNIQILVFLGDVTPLIMLEGVHNLISENVELSGLLVMLWATHLLRDV